MRNTVKNTFYYFCLPGVVVHEIAHAIIIVLLPNMRITKLNLFSNVEYEGNYTTATRTFLIAYAPLLLNSSISVWSVYTLAKLDNFANIKLMFYSMFLTYISLTMAFSAIPSVSDAKAPLIILRKQLFTIRFILIVILAPVFILLSLPGLIISYISSKSIYIQIILCLVYSILVFLIGFEVIEINFVIPSQFSRYLNY